MIHTISVPTPFAVGRVNCYLVDDDPLTLVDTGPNSGASLVALVDGLEEHGRRIEDLQRIVLTHQHIDHTGLAQILVDRSGAEVCAHEDLVDYLADFRGQADADDEFAYAVMLRHGIPADVASALRAVTAQFRGWGAPVTIDTALADGDTLAFAGRSWRVGHRPGHSPSDTIFHDEAAGTLVGGDHLIKHVSSNPIVHRSLVGEPDPAHRPQALVTYIASLRRTAAMELDVVLPGHGDPVTEHAALVADRLAMHDRRKRKIAALLADGPRTGFELTNAMWGNIAVTQAYLTLSEVLGHLDLLLNDGEAVEEVDGDGVVHFALTP